MSAREAVTPEEIAEQREKGWPDFHPEDYCHECGMANPRWWAPEWPVVVGHGGGITCPRCFMLKDPDQFWVVARWQRQDRDADMAAFLRSVSNLGDDADRVAGCIRDYLVALAPVPLSANQEEEA